MHDKQEIVSTITDCAMRLDLHCDGLRDADRRNDRTPELYWDVAAEPRIERQAAGED